MKAAWSAAFGVLITFTAAQPAHAQALPRLPRADLNACIGFQSLHQPVTFSSDGWIHAIHAVRLAAALYWTEHVRAAFEADVGSEATQYRIDAVTIGGRTTFQSSRLDISRRSAGLAVQYQFRHNTWVHPYAGGGALVTYERRLRTLDPIVVPDPVTHDPATVGARVEGPLRRMRLRPFVDAGLKAYLTKRTYFVQDTRVVVSGRGVDQLMFSFGFGVDF
jgi:hypothetical protein